MRLVGRGGMPNMLTLRWFLQWAALLFTLKRSFLLFFAMGFSFLWRNRLAVFGLLIFIIRRRFLLSGLTFLRSFFLKMRQRVEAMALCQLLFLQNLTIFRNVQRSAQLVMRMFAKVFPFAYWRMRYLLLRWPEKFVSSKLLSNNRNNEFCKWMGFRDKASPLANKTWSRFQLFLAGITRVFTFACSI